MQWHPSFGFREAGIDLRDPSLYLPPDGGSPVLPPLAYQSKAFQDLEDEQVWTRNWICAGLSTRIPDAGDLLPYTIGFHGTHVQRLSDGSLRGAFNLAQHGGCRTVPEQCRTGQRTRCSYTSCGHSRDRDVITAVQLDDSPREAGQYLGFNPAKLVSVALECLGPLVFLHVDPDPPPLGVELGTLSTDMHQWARYDTPLAHETVDVASNWKIAACAALSSTDLPQRHAVAATDGPDVPYRGWWACPAGSATGGPDELHATLIWPNVIVATLGPWMCTVNLQPTGQTSHVQRWDISSAGPRTPTMDMLSHFRDRLGLAAAMLSACQGRAESASPDTPHSAWTGAARAFEARVVQQVLARHDYAATPKIYMNPVESAR